MALEIKKEEEHEEGAPGWMVTYGDMMSLLLCFFIMLVAMSEIKDEKFQRLLESIKQAFGGYPEAAEIVPGPKPKAGTLYENMQIVTTTRGSEKIGGAEVVNLHGREILCRSVREGTLYTMGDRMGFEKGSTEIPSAMQQDLDALVKLTKDFSNRLLVRGHASVQDAPEGTTDWELAFRRAVAVKDYLVSRGINPERICLSSCGRYDPIETNLTPTGRRSNRRVEIIVSEQLAASGVRRRLIDE
ncbi:MAG TPA: flagellar motor protein MotB [Planctomycetota bacterium]|nr:flagellar motor protein MotB [Planctomycetota bacterium]